MNGAATGILLLGASALALVLLIRGYFGGIVSGLNAAVAGTATKQPLNLAGVLSGAPYSGSAGGLGPGGLGAHGGLTILPAITPVTTHPGRGGQP